MKTSEVLKRAKKHLSRKYREGVCSAVWKATYESNVPSFRASDVTRMISDRIKPFGYASKWLAWRMAVGYTMPRSEFRIPGSKAQAIYDWLDKYTPKDIQAWRHAWLDSMITEFEAKGD